MTPVKRLLLLFAFMVAGGIAIIGGMEWRNEIVSREERATAPVSENIIAKGAYLARAGNCMGCHTARGGMPYAGGRQIETPFGGVVSSNITSDRNHGLGNWTPDDFWRAIHNGRSKDGKFLYPAFPYPNYTKVTRTDADAIFAFLQTVPASSRKNEEHTLRFPFNQRILLAAWRSLYFRPGIYEPEPAETAEWNRGSYLVQGLGHCNACHANRNVLGATSGSSDLAGGIIPILNWYAPSLTSDPGSGLGNWEVPHLVQLLKSGVSQRGAVLGPMAEVVRDSLQHLSDNDIVAMATYLKLLPQQGPLTKAVSMQVAPAEVESMTQAGARLYERHCVGCHQASGEGVPPAYPPLSGNQSVRTASAINSIRIVLNGGFPPSTEGNPRPFGMPPFGPILTDAEIAAIVTFMRQAWGNGAGPVSPAEVARYRGALIE